MKISQIILKNVKSFKNEIKINFNEKINILIGANGSGKTNLIDIINSVLKIS